MDYISKIDNVLRPNITESETVLDLFAGCGGLSLGFEAAGYKTIGYEMDANAAETYRKNLISDCVTAKLNLSFEYPDAQIVVGGPPCQPFSVGGHQKGKADERNGFPIFIDAVRKLKPKVFMFENVRGLLYTNKWYFEMVIEELKEEGYFIDFALLNAVHFGVPQNRERLFVIGHKSNFKFPPKQKHRTTVGEAIGDTMFTCPPESKFLTEAQNVYIANYEKASDCINPRDLYFDRPARTLTCRNLSAATGDMQRVKTQDGRRRRLLVREAARLQSFPDWFEFAGAETSQFNQIGNAVPPLLAYNLALAVKNCFQKPEIDFLSKQENVKLPVNSTLSLF
jgi:DNA (cytosine-5)-methyltransferase 1